MSSAAGVQNSSEIKIDYPFSSIRARNQQLTGEVLSLQLLHGGGKLKLLPRVGRVAIAQQRSSIHRNTEYSLGTHSMGFET